MQVANNNTAKSSGRTAVPTKGAVAAILLALVTVAAVTGHRYAMADSSNQASSLQLRGEANSESADSGASRKRGRKTTGDRRWSPPTADSSSEDSDLLLLKDQAGPSSSSDDSLEDPFDQFNGGRGGGKSKGGGGKSKGGGGKSKQATALLLEDQAGPSSSDDSLEDRFGPFGGDGDDSSSSEEKPPVVRRFGATGRGRGGKRTGFFGGGPGESSEVRSSMSEGALLGRRGPRFGRNGWPFGGKSKGGGAFGQSMESDGTSSGSGDFGRLSGGGGPGRFGGRHPLRGGGRGPGPRPFGGGGGGPPERASEDDDDSSEGPFRGNGERNGQQGRQGGPRTMGGGDDDDGLFGRFGGGGGRGPPPFAFGGGRDSESMESVEN